MLNYIEAMNYRCLRYIRQDMDLFHVLVGPNASGKTTFLDVVGLLGQIVSDGLETALKDRTPNFDDLLFKGEGRSFELAIEAVIPEERKTQLKKDFNTIRYEVRIGKDQETDEVGILEERVLLKPMRDAPPSQRSLFPMEVEPPGTILHGKGRIGERTVLSKSEKGNDNFYSEVREKSGKGWYPSIRLGPLKSALANLHEDETKFPVSTWLKRTLTEGVQGFVLNSLALRKASPPGQSRKFKTDGSNLPWVIEEFRKSDSARFRDWLGHVQTALPDITDVKTHELPDIKHRYLKICYQGGYEVPSWMASDGTLRLLALTLPAYIKGLRGIYLIEEPENGIHPSAVEAAFQSLSSAYDAQILLASHSPVILSMAEPEQVLCFKKTDRGSTDITRGSDHPALKDWKGQPNLGVLFASGVLG